MWLFFYNIMVHIAFVACLPWLVWKAWRTGKFKEGFGERFGHLSAGWVPSSAARRPIWIHAVSVGEAQMLPPILERLSRVYPDVPVVVSTNTVTGQAVAKSLPRVAGSFYVPLDLSWAVRKVIRLLRPRLLVIFETEIWPNLIAQNTRSDIPVIFLNGRIGDRSFQKYLKIRFFLRRILQFPRVLGMRSDEDARRILAMGAPLDRVRVLGNLKFESAFQLVHEQNLPTRQELGISDEALLIVAGSTFPGEEEMLLAVFKQLHPKNPRLRLLVAPRHPERFEEVAQLIETSGLPLHRFSTRSPGTVKPQSDTSPILLLDVMGQLKKIYSLATVVFIGKSMGLTPSGCGGQNPLEPAAWSKPVVCGKSMQNFQEVVDALSHEGGLWTVDSPDRLAEVLDHLLSRPEECARMGQSAFRVIERSLGAADRCLEVIQEILPVQPGEPSASPASPFAPSKK